jgi:hypothetical protein
MIYKVRSYYNRIVNESMEDNHEKINEYFLIQMSVYLPFIPMLCWTLDCIVQFSKIIDKNNSIIFSNGFLITVNLY